MSRGNYSNLDWTQIYNDYKKSGQSIRQYIETHQAQFTDANGNVACVVTVRRAFSKVLTQQQSSTQNTEKVQTQPVSSTGHRRYNVNWQDAYAYFSQLSCTVEYFYIHHMRQFCDAADNLPSISTVQLHFHRLALAVDYKQPAPQNDSEQDRVRVIHLNSIQAATQLATSENLRNEPSPLASAMPVTVTLPNGIRLQFYSQRPEQFMLNVIHSDDWEEL